MAGVFPYKPPGLQDTFGPRPSGSRVLSNVLDHIAQLADEDGLVVVKEPVQV
jgi:hypothetical protein